MKLSSHAIAQTLLTLLNLGNWTFNLIPAKYKPWVSLVMTAAQGALAIINHNYNPDGTPATVAYMKKAAMLILALLLPGLLYGQTSPTFSISTQAVAIRLGGQTVPGTDAIGTFGLTKTVFLQSDNMLAPANNFQGYFGGVKVYPSFLSKPLAKTSLSSVTPYLHVAIGIVRNVPATGTSQQHYGALAGGGFDYHVNDTFNLGPRIEYLNGPGFGPHPHGVAVSANLTIVLRKQ